MISTLVEFRIRSAYISWQLRNIVNNQYGFVPGYLASRRATNFYGVRWEFYN